MLRIHDELFEPSDPGLAAALASLYGTGVRPACMCQAKGVEMYIAKIAGRYAVRRMPRTGPDHAADCDSYEPPAELSGLGQLMGTAIDEDTEQGTITLRFGFSLTKTLRKNAPSAGTTEKDGVKPGGDRLTLRGTLHYLWEQAGFNRWSPAMEGKRSWAVIRKYLLLAAENKIAKGGALTERLYIPETFSADRKAEIAQRRMSCLARASAPAKETRQLMIVMGEIAEIGKSRFGFRVRFRHVPDCDFMMSPDLHARLQKRFATEIGLWDANSANGVHLIAIATVGTDQTGVPVFEEIALMAVSPDWVPFETQFELMLLTTLRERKRRYVKGLRYNLPSTSPLATLVLSDTGLRPTALYVVPFGAPGDYLGKMNELLENSRLASWKWEPGTADLPALPPAGNAKS